jgi:hypothetical protein
MTVASSDNFIRISKMFIRIRKPLIITIITLLDGLMNH